MLLYELKRLDFDTFH